MKYNVISADSHINEPPGVFIDRVPAHLKDKAPRILRGADGGDGWSWDGKPPKTTFGLNLCAGVPYKSYKASGLTLEEIRPGNYDGQAHLDDMAIDHVDASVVYPMAVLGSFLTDDKELGLSCIKAYNDWLFDDFCSADPTRLIGLPVLPVDHGIEETLAEFHRTVKKGARAMFLVGCPTRQYHDPMYDPLWAAAQAANIPVSVHRTLGGAPTSVELQDEPIAATTIRFFSAARPFSNMVNTGVFDRFPDLKLLAAEVNFGWLAFWTATMEDLFDRHHHHAGLSAKRPKEYVGKNLFVTYMEDPIGFKLIDEVPHEALLFSTDYPHGVTIWPRSQEVIEQTMSHLPENVQYDLLAGNAVKLFNLPQE